LPIHAHTTWLGNSSSTSTYSLRHSLENRVRRLRENLKRAKELARLAPSDLPSQEDLEEMEDDERERLEDILSAVSLSQNPQIVQDEIAKLELLTQRALTVEDSCTEAKLVRLKAIVTGQDTEFYKGEDFLSHPERRLLIFTEFRDTLDYLVSKLRQWGFAVETIHGSMKPGSRDEPGTRLYAEQKFRDGPAQGGAQILVATEAAGEGINLQCCNILLNYDIPWNPNRLEQRMGRIHRYGQTKDCYIFNFIATNTIEGQVLNKLLHKLQEIRDALDDDAVFNVVGEVLPSSQIERTLRDYYAGKLGDADLENRVMRNVQEEDFRNICQNALEGLATKKLNLAMLVERRARAQERRLVPETIARFLQESAPLAGLPLKEIKSLAHTFEPGTTPSALREYESKPNWRLPRLANRYPRLSTDRKVADANALEWITPGHALFEALRLHTWSAATEILSKGACFHWLDATSPLRLDFYRARIVDGLGNVIHERMFVIQLEAGKEPVLREPGILGNLVPTKPPATLPTVAGVDEVTGWLNEHALRPFVDEVRGNHVFCWRITRLFDSPEEYLDRETLPVRQFLLGDHDPQRLLSRGGAGVGAPGHGHRVDVEDREELADQHQRVHVVVDDQHTRRRRRGARCPPFKIWLAESSSTPGWQKRLDDPRTGVVLRSAMEVMSSGVAGTNAPRSGVAIARPGAA
jgi:hypothetical protein